MLYASESVFERFVGGSYYRQHMLGMFILGLLIYGFMLGFGHYYIEGVGYATIQDVLSGAQMSIFMLLLLFAFKLLATCLTLGSGASGGVFSPALFIGATLGGAYGMALRLLVPRIDIGPTAFAVVGMSGVVAGSTAAAVTAIVMIFEMTLDYRVIVPMTLTVAVAYGIRRAIVKQSIYTRKLVLRGHLVPEALQANVYFERDAKSLMDTGIETILGSDTLGKLRSRLADHDEKSNWFLVNKDNRIIGVISRGLADDERERPEARVEEIARRDICTCSEETSLGKISTIMRRTNAHYVLVGTDGSASTDHVKGVITKERILDVVAEAIGMFEE
jgi:CIC family chloride channel protein